MIDIDTTLYQKVPRGKALAILEQAKMTPDDFTAHRDGTYTARYLRDRNDTLRTLGIEDRMERADRRVAILKRPSDALDRGRYVTLRFAVVKTETLGIRPKKETAKPVEADVTVLRKQDKAVLDLLKRVATNMQQLTDYAQELAKECDNSHMSVILEELEDQVELFRDGLNHITT